MACIYSAFCNRGNIIKPYLLYKRTPDVKYWMEEAFCDETVNHVLKGMKGVVNNPYGTGYEAYFDDIALAGKTGTAEIDNGKETIGWVSAVNENIAITMMVDKTKDKGYSQYVLPKVQKILTEVK